MWEWLQQTPDTLRAGGKYKRSKQAKRLANDTLRHQERICSTVEVQLLKITVESTAPQAGSTRVLLDVRSSFFDWSNLRHEIVPFNKSPMKKKELKFIQTQRIQKGIS